MQNIERYRPRNDTNVITQRCYKKPPPPPLKPCREFPNGICSTNGVYTCTNDQIKGNSVGINECGNITMIRPSVSRFCDDCTPDHSNDPLYIYPSQRLSGCPNPRTLIPPVITPPLSALDYWKTNNLVTMSGINDESQEESYLSGFQISTCCGTLNNEYLIPNCSSNVLTCGNIDSVFPAISNSSTTEPPSTRPSITSRPPRPTSTSASSTSRPTSTPASGTSRPASGTYRPTLTPASGTSRPTSTPMYTPIPTSTSDTNEVSTDFEMLASSVDALNEYPRENFYNFDRDEAMYRDIGENIYNIDTNIYNGEPSIYNTTDDASLRLRRKRFNEISEVDERDNFVSDRPEDNCWEQNINVTCGYEPDQIKYGLPSNLAVGNCMKTPEYKDYNDSIFTQIIEPGIYYRTEVNEPINANIGISFTQPFEPTTCKTSNKGLLFTEHDPTTVKPRLKNDVELNEAIDISNVYDPRFNGYGTSYRSYSDDLLGQTRFMYDDINAIRMPNYIVRSDIDNQPYADSYGPIQPGNECGNEFNSKIRALANDSYMKGTSQFRTDLEERLMRKTNAQAWQRKLAPIRTYGQKC